MNLKKLKLKSDYDRRHSILYFNWGGEVKFSVAMGDDVILDVNKNDEIVGIEIFDVKKVKK